MLWSTLSLGMLAIFSLVAAAFIVAVWLSYDTVNGQKEQILNWSLADDVAATLQPVLDSPHTYWDIQRKLDTFIRYHRGIDLYVLDANGTILAASRANEALETAAIDTAPILHFLGNAPADFGLRAVYGDSPRNMNTSVPFSAAELRLPGGKGFLYVNLLGGTQHILFDYSKERATVLICAAAFVSLIVLTAFSGLWLKRRLTDRLITLAAVAKEFQAGRLEKRVAVSGTDELSILGETMNSMADALERQMITIGLKDRRRRDLITDISHDLRSPAALIAGYSEVLLTKDLSLSERARQYGEVIARNASSLQELLSELFELARLDSVETRATIEKLPLGELLSTLASRYKDAALGRGIALDIQVADALPPILADSIMLERAVGNLVENAIRYTPSGGRITLGAAAKGKGVRVSIIDTGVGMGEAALGQIFERHYQDEKQDQAQKGLSGLGLAIVRTLLEAQGSEIQVESTLGVGTTFWFELPIAHDGETP